MKGINTEKPKAKTSSPYGETTNELGCVRIYQGVVSSLARNAVCSVEGVAKLAGASLVDNIGELIGNQKILDRAIRVELDGNTASIEVEVNLKYGVNIPVVAAEIQAKVAEEVKRSTGMEIECVDIIVQELSADAEVKAQEE